MNIRCPYGSGKPSAACPLFFSPSFYKYSNRFPGRCFKGLSGTFVRGWAIRFQYAGRLHRLHPDKTEVRIYDYVDRDVPMLARMFERRLRGYRAIGYSTEEVTSDL